ncbi:MAG: UDP-N-acetylmuramoyl-L-alanine--D-glutamate ligase [Lactobacillales bacterium]|nr:UDP-N-acetylmuramoyl-L-alanine--D-glutamate ligase [Lactobacillales bacterium]
MYNKIVEKLKNKNIAILGFGKEGKSTYNFIRKHLPNQKITILDKNDILKNNDYLKNDNNLEIIVGENYLSNLEIYDLIIKSPGISFYNIDITKIKDKISSQLELLLEINNKNIIGITGTKGKSTTSSLIYNMIKDQTDNVFLLGNIGNPIFDYIDEFNDETLLVIEMSSHQLEYINYSPHIGIILNLFQDHLDHAGTVENYHNAKMNMFKYQTESDIAIYDGQNDNLNNLIKINNYKSNMYNFKLEDKDSYIYSMNNLVYFNNEIIYDGNKPRSLIGSHNLKNIMVCLLICKILNLDINKAIKSINEFKPLEHRLELVGTYNNITYFNDTIATIPEATINGINGLKCVDTLIFGGMDRKIDYNEFIDYLYSSNISNLIGMPETGYTICNILKDKNSDKNIFLVSTLDEAVDIADKYTKKDHICLLSPAASSYNEFKNYEEKGMYYKQIIKKKYNKKD